MTEKRHFPHPQYFTEYMRDTMTELTRFFRVTYNCFKDFTHDLQTIYNEDIIGKCAPSMITPNAKYNPTKPQIASMNAHLSTNDDISKEET